jgi:hypothetical protein
VVYYNALILSEVLAEPESRAELASAEVLKRVSPVAWQHINFYGRYQFDGEFTSIDFPRSRQQLSSEEVFRLYATADH